MILSTNLDFDLFIILKIIVFQSVHEGPDIINNVNRQHILSISVQIDQNVKCTQSSSFSIIFWSIQQICNFLGYFSVSKCLQNIKTNHNTFDSTELHMHERGPNPI